MRSPNINIVSNIKGKIDYALNNLITKASFKKALEIFYSLPSIVEEANQNQERVIEKSQEKKLWFMTTLWEKVIEKIFLGFMIGMLWILVIGMLAKVSEFLATVVLLGLFAKFLWSIIKGINFFAEPYFINIDKKVDMASWSGDRKNSDYFHSFESPSSFIDTLKTFKESIQEYHEYCDNVNYYNDLLSKTSIASEYNLKPLENAFTLGMQYSFGGKTYTEKDYIDSIEAEILPIAEYFGSMTFTESTFTKDDIQQMKNLIDKTHQLRNWLKDGFDRLTNKENNSYQVHYNEVFGEDDMKDKIENLKKIEQDISQVLGEIKAYLSLNPSSPILQLKFNTIKQKLLFAKFNLSVLTKNTFKDEVQVNNAKSEELKKALSDMNDKLVALGKVQQEINFLLQKEIVNPTSAIRAGDVISKVMMV